MIPRTFPSRLAALAVAGLLLPAGAAGLPALTVCPTRISQAIAYQQLAADSHARWIAYIESGRASAAELRIAGDAAWHRAWIERYVFTEGVLRERCRTVE